MLAPSPGPFLPKRSCLTCPQAATALQQNATPCDSLNLAIGEEHLVGQDLGARTLRKISLGHILGGAWSNIASSVSPFLPLSGGLGSKEPRPKGYQEQESEAWVANGKSQGSQAPPSMASLLVMALGRLSPRRPAAQSPAQTEHWLGGLSASEGHQRPTPCMSSGRSANPSLA